MKFEKPDLEIIYLDPANIVCSSSGCSPEQTCTESPEIDPKASNGPIEQ